MRRIPAAPTIEQGRRPPADVNERSRNMSNEELQRHVVDELFWDPKVDSDAIAVSADGGAVTLRGTVGSFREKREAKAAAERVYGVTSVDNRLQVRILSDAGATTPRSAAPSSRR
jgi:osmotically-inducible protein OsmY